MPWLTLPNGMPGKKATLDDFILAANKLQLMNPPATTYEMTRAEFDQFRRVAIQDVDRVSSSALFGLQIVIKEPKP